MASSSVKRHLAHCRIDPKDAIPVVVTATFRTAPVIPIAFAAPLDGILASAAHRNSHDYGMVTDHHTVTLPLTSTAHLSPFRARWVWAASCAWWDHSEEDITYLHHRGWDQSNADLTGTPTPSGTGTGAGRWKPWRIPQVSTVTHEMHWWASGDPDGIRDLLDDIMFVGDGKAGGRGEVHRWTVTPADHDIWWFPDGRISRPIPVRAAKYLGLDQPDTLAHNSYRPPYWRPKADNTGDRFARSTVEVIAPWTLRP